MVIEDTDWDSRAATSCWSCRVYTSPRSEEQKQLFYATLLAELQEHCGLSADDLMISVIGNQKGDWSFGRGVAQYMTGEL